MADEGNKHNQDTGIEAHGNQRPAASAVERATKRADIANIAANAREAASALTTAKRLSISESLVDQAARVAGLSSTSKAMEAARSLTDTFGSSSNVQKLIEEASGTVNFARRMMESPTDRLMRDSGFANSNLIKNATGLGAIAEIDRYVSGAIGSRDQWARLRLEPSFAEKIIRQNSLMADTVSKLSGLSSFTRLGLGFEKYAKPDLSIWSKIAEDARGLASNGFAGKALADAMRPNWPEAFPEYRKPDLAQIISAPLGPLASSVFASRSLIDHHRQALARLRSPWADVDDPFRSITALGEARALAELVRFRSPQSRKLVQPLREELGDYRHLRQPPQEIVDDPVLRTIVQHEAGFSGDLAALAPAAVAWIASSLSISIKVDVAFDEEAVSLVLYRECRKLERRLRHFIDQAMSAKFGKNWLKHRSDGKLREQLNQRRETDIANGRTPSALLDYADFTDYSRIIERGDNWREVFGPAFGMRVAFSETMRRLALVRNPTAHFRTVTVEDLMIFAIEACHLNRWLDRSPTIAD